MPEAPITDSVIARQLKITEKALNKGRVASNDHESIIQSTVQSSLESRYCGNPYSIVLITLTIVVSTPTVSYNITISVVCTA